MRLKGSRSRAQEQLFALLNAGYELRWGLWTDYEQRRNPSAFKPEADNKRYAAMVDEWANEFLVS